MSFGWSPDMVAGGAAAAVETGVPQFMMAMLIRAGLPSRRAAMAAIEDAAPVFVTPAEMRVWLESDDITAKTDAGDWTTPDTSALWARFRTDALSGGIQKWSVERYKRLLDTESPARWPLSDRHRRRGWPDLAGSSRLPADRRLQEASGWSQAQLILGPVAAQDPLVDALRVGRGKLRWQAADI